MLDKKSSDLVEVVLADEPGSAGKEPPMEDCTTEKWLKPTRPINRRKEVIIRPYSGKVSLRGRISQA